MRGLLIITIFALQAMALFIGMSLGITGWSLVGLHAVAYILAFGVSLAVWSRADNVTADSFTKHKPAEGENV